MSLRPCNSVKSSLAAASALLVEGGGDEAAHRVSIDYGRRKHVYRPLDCAAFTCTCEAMIFPELHALSEPPSEGAAEADPKRIQCGRDGWPQMPLAELQSQCSRDCQKEFASILCGCAAAQQQRGLRGSAAILICMSHVPGRQLITSQISCFFPLHLCAGIPLESRGTEQTFINANQ